MKLRDPITELLDRKGRHVWAVSPGAAVFEAISRMSEKRVGALVVLEANRLVGIISERDYTRKVILESRSSKQTSVREIMSSEVVCVRPAATVDECMQLMTEHHIRHLPVVEGETVVGVISIGDLVQWIISTHEVLVDQLNNYITGRYPA